MRGSFGSIEFLKTEEPSNEVVFASYLLSFINYILFITYVITSYFYYEQIKWGMNMSFKFLKITKQFLETGLQVISFRNQFLKIIAKN